jgi:hypothetical protein
LVQSEISSVLFLRRGKFFPVLVDGWSSAARGWRRQGSGGGEEEKREETRAQQRLQVCNSSRSFLIRNWRLFLHAVAPNLDLAFSAGLDPAFNPNLDPEQSFGSVFRKSESGFILLLNADPMRTRIQTKNYFDKICKKSITYRYVSLNPYGTKDVQTLQI